MASYQPEPFVSTEDNVVLSDLLFFIANRLHTHDMDSIIQVCDAFYDKKTISEEKSRFFKSISKSSSDRRSNKNVKNLEDIITEMRNREKPEVLFRFLRQLTCTTFP